jgi:hypothetical protein
LSTVVTVEEVVPDFAKITLTPDKASLSMSSTRPLMVAEPDVELSSLVVDAPSSLLLAHEMMERLKRDMRIICIILFIFFLHQ